MCCRHGRSEESLPVPRVVCFRVSGAERADVSHAFLEILHVPEDIATFFNNCDSLLQLSLRKLSQVDFPCTRRNRPIWIARTGPTAWQTYQPKSCRAPSSMGMYGFDGPTNQSIPQVTKPPARCLQWIAGTEPGTDRPCVLGLHAMLSRIMLR
jgi:hypothetical protein